MDSESDIPDAVFAANDLIALGLEQALIADGRIRLTHDLYLGGYDDIAFAETAIIPRQPSANPSILCPAKRSGYSPTHSRARTPSMFC